MEWNNINDITPELGQICLVVADGIVQWMALTWINDKFVWADGAEYGESSFDPFPTERATHWMPFPKFP